MIMLCKFRLQWSYIDSMTHAQTWRTERKAERGKGERCKEVPRGSISPASEHINRSQPYYSQSKADENRRKKSTGGKGERSKEGGRKSPESGHHTWIYHVTKKKKTTEPLRQTCELSSHEQKTFVFRLDNSEANQWTKLSLNLPVLFDFGGKWKICCSTSGKATKKGNREKRLEAQKGLNIMKQLNKVQTLKIKLELKCCGLFFCLFAFFVLVVWTFCPQRPSTLFYPVPSSFKAIVCNKKGIYRNRSAFVERHLLHSVEQDTSVVRCE